MPHQPTTDADSPTQPAGLVLASRTCCAFGDVRLYLGDCLELLPEVGKFGAVVTDPPYGIGWDTDYRRFTGEGKKCKGKQHKPVHGDDKPFDPRPWLMKMPVVLFGANYYAAGLPIGSWLVWDKRFANGKAFLAQAEVAWMNRGHGVYLYAETCQGAVRKERAEHPTQKPVGVMVWTMEKANVPADAVVIDPYMGAGSTGVACVRTGRGFIGIERDPEHFETARRRIEAEYLRHNDQDHESPEHGGDSK